MMNNLVSSLVCINLPNIRISCKLTFTSKGDLGESVFRNRNDKCAFVSVCNHCMCIVLCLCCVFDFCVCKIPHFFCRLQTNQLHRHANYYNKIITNPHEILLFSVCIKSTIVVFNMAKQLRAK